MRFFSALALSALLGAAAAAPRGPSSALAPESGNGEEEFVVLMENDAESVEDVTAALRKLDLSPTSEEVLQMFNNTAFTGFVVRTTAERMARLEADDKVDSIETAAVDDDTANATLTTQKSKPRSRFTYSRNSQISSHATTRLQAPWGLERLSSTKPIDGDQYKLEHTYTYASDKLGQGVDIYVIDTGIQANHDAFFGRARMGFSVTDVNGDDEGHGTHVAGTAAGTIVGVASDANIIGVKVLGAGGVGSAADAIRGIDYAVSNHDLRRSEPGFKASILSLSIGPEGREEALETAIRAVARRNIHVSIAAGNKAIDACDAAAGQVGGQNGDAVSVGSIGPDGTISKFSNHGRCVDVYAPGEGVLSTWLGGDRTDLVTLLSGTSMACPHVTGLMAYYINLYPELALDPARMKQFLISTARRGFVRPGPNGELSGDAMLLASNGQDGGSIRRQLLERQGRRSSLSSAGGRGRRPLLRPGNGVFKRVRRAVADKLPRWVIGSNKGVSAFDGDGTELSFELVDAPAGQRF